jgi:hypothetical protein
VLVKKPVVLALLLGVSNALAADRLTKDMIREVIEASDAATMRHDTAGIGAALGSNFYKYIEIPSMDMSAAARIDKQQYLKMIDSGWTKTNNYHYQRKDVVIHLSPEGDSGESFSTIIEHFEIDGTAMISKVREYALYALEDGRAVIVNIDSQTLVGDTTP